MKKLVLALAALASTVPIAAQKPRLGDIIAAYYMEKFSRPKGWVLSYKGPENGVEVFIMDRDFDAHPQTAFLEPIGQMERLMCGDKDLKQLVAEGYVVRIDSRDKSGGKTKYAKGPTLSRC
ncbi:MAG: hypothetical protein GXC70_02760 [Sphingomonadaceae bacterium]|nr:hypothetical protein [Sphingomonadaceae bacterium]